MQTQVVRRGQGRRVVQAHFFYFTLVRIRPVGVEVVLAFETKKKSYKYLKNKKAYCKNNFAVTLISADIS
jgi:hypothetical protein